jgi:murein DD-endopeptidase MepM/ murein hydrolase activator NlpD
LPWSDTASYAISGNAYYCDTHRGAEQFAIDFGLPDGTAVTAVFAGTAYRASSTAGGLAIYVQPAGGFPSYYGHLSQQIATNGQAVVQGTVIGYSGHTGSQTPGPHLHFSIKQGGSGVFRW